MKRKAINTKFKREWTPFRKIHEKVMIAIHSHLLTHDYRLSSLDGTATKVFHPADMGLMRAILGLSFKQGKAAGVVLDEFTLLVDKNKVLKGFAVNTDGQVIGIAYDQDRNKHFIEL